ncbi:MAG: mechanosensitive ion channel family protein, partial [Rhodobiaceae bacterium]|nr:mechanosensitive ion channel family protein [Rhodobiaceae bacterium]
FESCRGHQSCRAAGIASAAPAWFDLTPRWKRGTGCERMRLIAGRMFLWLVLGLMLAWGSPAVSQTQTGATSGQKVEPNIFDGFALRLEQIATALNREGVSSTELTGYRDEILSIQAKAQAEITSVQPKLDEVNARLSQLGDPPENDADELEEVAMQRELLNRQKAPLDSSFRRAKVVEVQAGQTLDLVETRQRHNFTERLTARSQSILAPLLWSEFFADLPQVLSSLKLLLADTLHYLQQHFSLANAGLLLASVIASFFVWRMLTRYLERFAGSRDDTAEVSSDRKAAAALIRFVRGAILPVLAIIIPYATFRSQGVLPPRAGSLADSIVSAIDTVLIYRGLTQAYLASRRPAWRIIRLETSTALTISSLVILAAAFVAIDRVMSTIGEITFAPVSFEAATSGLNAMIIAVLIIVTLRRFANAMHKSETAGAEVGFMRWPILRVLTWPALAIVIFGGLFGFLSLSSFAAIQLVGAILIIGMFRLFIVVVRQMIHKVTSPGGSLNALGVREFSISESTTHQIGLLIAGVAQVILVALAAAMLLMPLGFDATRWINWIQNAASGFQIGDVRISPIAIIVAIVVFFVLLIVTRSLRGWMENTYLPATNLDPGLRNSISTAVGYIGLFVASALAISYAGFDLSKLAIIAGALSVGIGFGLQSVVSNFVSGLILLAERPIKAGDWIIVSGQEGTVRKISVRATEIETFDRASVIVPNSDLISSTVVNWTHSNTLGRFSIPVDVSYDSDPEQVRDLLLQIVNDHPDVLSYPEPRVFFMDFGSSSLDFRVDGYLKDIGMTLVVRSALRFTIFKRFKEAGIEIPFPQSDLHLRSVDPDAAVVLSGGSPSGKGGAE